MSASADLNKHVLPSPARTQGDGMETTDNRPRKSGSFSTSDSPGCSSLDSFLHRSSTAKAVNSPVIVPGTVINLSPKYFTQTRKQTLSFAGFKSKEPKFVPYEPYKAAVNFIVPTPRHSRAKHKACGNIVRTDSTFRGESKEDNNSQHVCEDTESIVSAVGSVSEKECVEEKDEEDSSVPKSWTMENDPRDAEIKQLKEENGQLELQLKFQAQVNAELKKLLVAAVGEDLQLRVNHLTEDKLQLAHALLNSAESLSTHQEQTEWLAGQCEVWRSKFLASSLMVEELAHWKAALSQKAVDLQDCLRNMLHERSEIHGTMGSTFRELGVLRDNFDAINTVTGTSDRRDAASLNLKDLATACLQTSELLTLQLLGGAKNIRSRSRPIERHLTVTPTPTEKKAEELLQQPVAQLLASGPDVACTAVMGAANALAGRRLFPQISSNVTTCCAHCSGDEKVL